MSNQFCRYLGNQYRFNLDGVKPCCYYRKEIKLYDKPAFEQLHNQLTAQTDWTPECGSCREKELVGQVSPRQNSLLYYKHHGLNGPDEPDVLTRLEIQTDTDCNGACLICSPLNSTTWQKFESKFNNTIVINDSRNETIKIFERIKEVYDFSKLKHMGFVHGGEPLKSATHLMYLRELDRVGNLENVVVSYVTNGSIRPCDETVSLWQKAKEVQLSLSVDGIDDHFNYLRWPLNFEHVKDNITYILGLNVKGLLGFSFAVTPFSAFYYDRYVDWANQFFKGKGGSMKAYNFFEHPFGTGGNVNMGCVPPRLRFELLKKFGLEHPISKILSPFSLDNYRIFIDYINEQDQRRGLNFRTVFPEVERYFKD